jgi:RNA polymerase sigma factor (sigma-70 family)
MSEDGELLRRYAENRDEGAFAELARRHLDLVYSAALRQVRDAQMAEDVAQMVFLKLARKAASLSNLPVLPGWLHADTRLTALQVLRAQRRRTAREAVQMEAKEATTAEWEEMRPVIDEALAELETGERDAVLLRFFGDRSFAEIGELLRLAPDAARMRVNRALEKLRAALARRGIKTTTAALGAALLANASPATPLPIATNISRSLTASLRGVTRTGFWRRGPVVAGGALTAAAAVVMLLLWSTPSNPPLAKPTAQAPVQGARTVAAEAETRFSVPEPAAAATTKSLRLRVIDEATGVPLPEVAIEVRTFTARLRGKRETVQTGADGTVNISLPTEHERDFHHQLHLSKDGYVARYVSWSTYQHDEFESIPGEYTARMGRGIEIGGLVRAGGEPIAGVKIVFSGPSPVGIPPRERDTTMGSYHTEITDSSGRWRCDHLRPEFRSTTFQLVHPNYRSVTYGCQETDETFTGPILLPQADYLAGTAEMPMEPGLLVRGMVVDEFGRSIAGATVTRDRNWNRKEATLTVGADGHFVFRDADPGEFILTVQAQGFAAETKLVQVEDSEVNFRVTLRPSFGLRGTVVNEAGVPIPDVEVSIERDPRFRELYQWSARTDALGGFFWDSSPNQPFAVDLSAYGFHRTNVTVHPGNDVQIITLNSEEERENVSLTLRLIDARTRKPVENATIHVEENRDGGTSPFSAEVPSNGLFTYKLMEPNTHYRFEARAPGYLPARTPSMRLTDTKEIELALTEAEGFTGTILGPDGEPVAGAEVALCTDEKGALLGRRQLVFSEQSIVVRSDVSGRFIHPPRLGAHGIYVIAPSGFAQLRLKQWKNGDPIQLQAWGRIAGVVEINGELARNTGLGLTSSPGNGIERLLTLHSFQTSTDAEGRFAFDDVPPMEVTLAWMIPTGGGGARYSHGMPVDVRPGTTTEVRFEPGGRTVRGRFQLAGNPEIDWPRQARPASLSVKMEKPPYQALSASMDPAQREKAYADFWESAEGREWSRRNRSFGVRLEQNGNFEIPAVPAGEYLLRVSVREKSERPFPVGKAVGSIEREITVPSGDRDLDLGEILIEPK